MAATRGGSCCVMFNDERAGLVRGKAGSDGGTNGGRFLGWAKFIGPNPGLTVALAAGVGSSVRLVWFGIK